MILHLRVVPGFGIAVETRNRPDLPSHPVVMGGLPHQRGTVREINPLAHHHGVRIGMTLSQAHQQCPEAIFLTPDLPRYEAVWHEIHAILLRYTPLVQPLDLGEAACDLSGCEHRWGDGWEAVREIAGAIYQGSGIRPCLAIASNRFVAQLASLQTGADGFAIIQHGTERDFVADLPLTLLPDLDARLALTFQVLGLRSMEQLASLPQSAVKQRFGSSGVRLHNYARGIDPRSVTPPSARQAITVRAECEDGSIEETLASLLRLAKSCSAELQQGRLAGTLITLSLMNTPLFTASLGRTARTTVQLPDCDTDSPAGDGETPCVLQAKGGEQATDLPIAYRIHSMLPQPGTPKSENDFPVAGTALSARHFASPVLETASPLPKPQSTPPCISRTIMVRTPVDTAAAVFEHARNLLLRLCPNGLPHLEAMELEISEFAQPAQLSFAELNRIDQTGALSGMDPNRLQALSRTEEALTARYGDASFRHVAQVDPSSVLTERRFRWEDGLPWRSKSTAGAARSSSRRAV